MIGPSVCCKVHLGRVIERREEKSRTGTNKVQLLAQMFDLLAHLLSRGIVGAGLHVLEQLVMPVAQALLTDTHRLGGGLEAVRFLNHQSHRVPLEIVRKPATSRRG